MYRTLASGIAPAVIFVLTVQYMTVELGLVVLAVVVAVVVAVVLVELVEAAGELAAETYTRLFS